MITFNKLKNAAKASFALVYRLIQEAALWLIHIAFCLFFHSRSRVEMLEDGNLPWKIGSTDQVHDRRLSHPTHTSSPHSLQNFVSTQNVKLPRNFPAEAACSLETD